MNWLKQLFGIGDKLPCDEHGLPYMRITLPMPDVKPCRVENCIFTNNSTIEGLKLALKHCTKYEDRMYLSFLIKVHLRNQK